MDLIIAMLSSQEGTSQMGSEPPSRHGTCPGWQGTTWPLGRFADTGSTAPRGAQAAFPPTMSAGSLSPHGCRQGQLQAGSTLLFGGKCPALAPFPPPA